MGKIFSNACLHGLNKRRRYKNNKTHSDSGDAGIHAADAPRLHLRALINQHRQAKFFAHIELCSTTGAHRSVPLFFISLSR